MDALFVQQRENVVRCACACPFPVQHIVRLFKCLADRDPTQRETIINPAVELLDRVNVEHLWPAIVALRLGAEYFSESQRERIIASVRNVLHSTHGLLLGLPIAAEVAPAVEYLGKPYRDAMFNRAINVQDWKYGPIVLRGLGTCIAHLDEAQREALLRAASSIASEDERDGRRSGSP